MHWWVSQGSNSSSKTNYKLCDAWWTLPAGTWWLTDAVTPYWGQYRPSDLRVYGGIVLEFSILTLRWICSSWFIVSNKIWKVVHWWMEDYGNYPWAVARLHHSRDGGEVERMGACSRELMVRRLHVGHHVGCVQGRWESEDVGHCHSTHQFPQWDPLFLSCRALSF